MSVFKITSTEGCDEEKCIHFLVNDKRQHWVVAKVYKNCSTQKDSEASLVHSEKFWKKFWWMRKWFKNWASSLYKSKVMGQGAL